MRQTCEFIINNHNLTTLSNIEKLISLGESETLEFKSSFNNETIETLVAFANTTGGKVLIGVNHKNEAIGVTINEESVQNWLNEIKGKTTPFIIPNVNIVPFEDKAIVIFTIQEYPIKPIATRGRYYKRIVNSNHLLNITEVVNLHLQSFNTSWDFHVNSQFKINDISLDKVQNAIDIVKQLGLNIKDDPLTFLRKNDLVREGQLTNAAYLLFTERDTVLTTIELGRFQTDTIIKDSSRTKSDITSQIEQVMDFVKKHINKEVIITGQPRNTQKWQYPLEAVREIITNMIIHRDYRATSDSIVKIFDNRIEFYNPGRLPDSITVNDLISNNYKSTPRNKLIADFCKSLGLIEKYGSGIRRIIEQFAAANLPQPKFRNISDGFMVTVFADSIKVTDKVTDNQRKIIDGIVRNNKITTKQLSDKVGISQRKIKENIQKLKEKGLLQRIGSAKSGHWQINY